MKTNTYAQFKSFVKTNCIDQTTACHWGDSAHLIYSAWYMFKHRLNEEERKEFLKKDFENMYKRMYNNGLSLYIEVNTKDISYKNSLYTSGGCEYDYRKSEYLVKWTDAVTKFFNIWNSKLEQEIKENE